MTSSFALPVMVISAVGSGLNFICSLVACASHCNQSLAPYSVVILPLILGEYFPLKKALCELFKKQPAEKWLSYEFDKYVKG